MSLIKPSARYLKVSECYRSKRSCNTLGPEYSGDIKNDNGIDMQLYFKITYTKCCAFDNKFFFFFRKVYFQAFSKIRDTLRQCFILNKGRFFPNRKAPLTVLEI